MTIDPVDWDAAYAAGTTPWDLGEPVPLLVEALAGGLLGCPGSALVPGCGRGYDAGALAEAGWRAVGVDLAPHALDEATVAYPAATFVLGDALDPQVALERTGGQVDLVWDHTFFCALPLRLRQRFGGLVRAVLKPGGLLASAVFPLDRPDDAGPPYRYLPEHMEEVIGDGFERIHLSPPVASMVPQWHRRLTIWRRVGAGAGVGVGGRAASRQDASSASTSTGTSTAP